MGIFEGFSAGVLVGVGLVLLLTSFYPTGFYSVQKQFVEAGCAHYDAKTGEFVLGKEK